MTIEGLSVIVASTGRPSLNYTLASITYQLVPGDELLVDVNEDAPWGHAARNRMLEKARPGNGLVFMDDDDVYLPNGLHEIRRAFRNEPTALHIFRMKYFNYDLWLDRQLVEGNVSTQMVCVAAGTGARFGDRYAGDFDFINAAAQSREVRWHRQVVAHYRPTPQELHVGI